MKKHTHYFFTPKVFISNDRNTVVNFKLFTLYKVLFFFLFLSSLSVNAQLSSKHYLPPLRQRTILVDGQTIYLSTPESTAFDVNVYQGTSTTPTATISISNSVPGTYTPPLGTAGQTEGGNNNTSLVTAANAGIVLTTAGFRFEAPSGKKFYVNWRSASLNQASSLVSTGEAGLGTDFRWCGIPFETPFAYFSLVNSVIGIMATEDNTHISIYGYNPACTFTRNGNTSGVNSITDDIINITLNSGETFVLEAIPESDISPNNNGWSGATISSDKKIAVNQGHMAISLTGNQDISMTQLSPTTGLGKEYAFVRGTGRDFAEFPVIIATQNNTQIFVNNEVTPIATLNNGQWFKIPSSKYSVSGNVGDYNGANMYVRTTKDAYAFQCISADNTTAPPTLDAFQCAPLNCLLDGGVNRIPDIQKRGGINSDLTSAAIMLVASSAITTNNIIVKHGVGGITTVPIATLNSNRKTISGTTDWVTYYIPGLTGDVSVQANGPVAVAYLGVQGAAGVAGYFSGFGSKPTINVQTNGNGCLPNTTLSAPTGFNSYIWYKNGIVIPNEITNTYTPTSIGDYNVEVSNGLCNFSTAVKTVFDCNPEVVVKTTASRKYLLPGETTTFTVSVKVYSDNVAQNVQISNLLPAHLDYTSSTVTKGTFTGTGSNYTWNVGNMSNGEENILTVVATAQTVNTTYSENYVTDNTQTFSTGTEANSITDDKTENVVIYSACNSSLAGTILGSANHCSTTNSTTLTASNAFGDLQWQSSSDNISFTDINGATASSLVVTNLATTTYYRVQATLNTCTVYATSVTIGIFQSPAFSMTSTTGSDAQTVCVNSNITNLTYTTTNTTGVTFSGLPNGVTGSWVNNVITISGAPSASGTFNFTVTLSGGCSVTITGSITVSNTNSISLASAIGTNGQTINNNAAITNITYTTTGATGASFSGLPNGITGTFSNNSITISGTPTLSGIYNYTITLTGGCGNITATGTITVRGVIITSSIVGSSICSGTSVTFTATATGITSPTYQWYKNGTTIAGANSSTYSTTTLSNNDGIKVAVNDGPTGTITSNGLILNLDAANPSSYQGTGNTWNNLITGNTVPNFTLSGGNFVNSDGGVIRFGSTGGWASSSTGFSNLNSFSVEVWVKPVGTLGDYDPTVAGNTNYAPCLFSEKVSGGTVNIALTYNARAWGGIPNNSYRYAAAMGAWATPAHPSTNYSSDLNSWTQIIATYNGSILSLYRNGALIASSTTNLTLRQSSTGYFIGHRWDMADGVYGDYSMINMYNRALSSSEVTANYGAFNSRFAGTSLYSNTITTSVNSSPTANVTVNGDACINKTTLTTTSGLASYVWYKDNVAISGATSSTYTPTTAGAYSVQVSDGNCSSISSTTSIFVCGLTAEGKMVSNSNATILVSNEGGTNLGSGLNDLGAKFSTIGLTTTTSSVGTNTVVLGGVISPTNGISSSFGVIYSTDANFGTYSSATIQSNVAAGTYSSTITGLLSSTTYYAKSFVVNSSGTSYGPVVNFTTAALPPVVTNNLVLNLDASVASSYPGSGATWSDLSGNNNNITLAGSYTYNVNGSIRFNGTGWGYNDSDILSKTAYTKQVWVKFNAFTSYANNIISGGNGMHAFWLAGSNPGNLQGGHNGAWSTVVENTNLSIGVWYNLAVTFSSSTGWVLYINGQQKNTSSNATIFTGIGNIQIASFGGAGNFLSGDIAQALVYNRTLTPSEILINYNNLRSRFGL